MKLFAPKYYKNFTCIADKCTHSCCVGWEIDIDQGTLEKYETLSHSYGKIIRDSIDYEETPHFRLCEKERCPHLDEKGLCNIISCLGEGYLCEICAEHPRFYNDTLKGKEVGLGLACEGACRIILESDEYAEITEVGDLGCETAECDFDAVAYRNRIYAILSDRSLPYRERLEKIHNEFNVSPLRIEDKKWHEIISDLEYLDENHKEIFLSYSSYINAPKELEMYLERALAYFVYRHITPSFDEFDFSCRLGLCLFLERLLCSLASKNAADIRLYARIISEEIEYSTDNTDRIAEIFDTI